MSQEVYNYYINTGIQDRDDKNYSFNFRLGNNIYLNKNQQAYFKIVNFSMMNAMLNVSSFHKNNQLRFFYNANNYYLTIPDGNYSVSTLKDKINDLLKTVFTPFTLVLNYNSLTNKFYWNTSQDYVIFYPQNMAMILGFTNDNYVIDINFNIYAEKFANLLSYTKIILTTNNLVFEPSTENNLNRDYSSNEGINEVICWIDKDIPTFATIKYENYMNIEHKLANRNITYINFNIVNEYKEVIKDAPNCFIHFQIIVRENNLIS